MDAKPKSTQQKTEQKDKKGKRSYKKPKIVEYGSLKELTQFGGSGSADFFGEMMGM